MKRFFLMMLLAGLTAPAALNAQKAYKDGTKVILELTEAAGMPAGAVTSTSKTTYYSTYTPSGAAANLENGTYSATVFQKLEISPGDDGTYMPWLSAYTGCLGATINGSTGWRMPTQKELHLMWLFKPALDALGAPIAAATYWSATEGTATTAWFVDFSKGTASAVLKIRDEGRMRCVREVTP